MKHVLAAAAVFLLSCATAQAATTFDFTTGNRSATPGTLNYSVDGINLSVSAGKYIDPFGWNNPLGVYDGGNIGQSHGNGLYMSNGHNDNHEIDGNGTDEVAIFHFSKNVTLEKVTFNYFGNDDDFAFFFDANADGQLSLVDGDLNANPTDAFTFLASLLKTGDLFGIGALGSNDDFKIASMTVSVSAVPLPAALPLYGAGIAVMGFIGWRRKQKLSAAA